MRWIDTTWSHFDIYKAAVLGALRDQWKLSPERIAQIGKKEAAIIKLAWAVGSPAVNVAIGIAQAYNNFGARKRK
jgi:hypothetical protein